jgi:hypothetical protein
MHCAVSYLDFSDGHFEISGIRVSRQIFVRPSVRADRHAGIDDLFSNLGVPARGLADFKEGRLETFVLERLEYGYGADRAGSIVECQNDFFVAKEFVSFQML